MQLKSFLQNEIVKFFHLILMANLSYIALVKLFLFFLTFLVAFSSSLKNTKFISFMYNLFLIVLDVLIMFYTPRVDLGLKLTFTFFLCEPITVL